MDLIFALIMLLTGRTRTPAPLRIQPGVVQTIPDPLPYVLYEESWGSQR